MMSLKVTCCSRQIISAIGQMNTERSIANIFSNISHGNFSFPYTLSLPEEKAAVAVTKQDYTPNTREVNVLPGTAVFPQDARLTPSGESISAGHTEGRSIPVNDRVSVFVSAGTFTEDTALTVTELGEQGLHFPLPAGWTPVCALLIHSYLCLFSRFFTDQCINLSDSYPCHMSNFLKSVKSCII